VSGVELRFEIPVDAPEILRRLQSHAVDLQKTYGRTAGGGDELLAELTIEAISVRQATRADVIRYQLSYMRDDQWAPRTAA